MKKEEEQFLFLPVFSHFSLFSISSLYVHSIPSFYCSSPPFIRQSIVDDDGDDDGATLPSLFRNSWTSTFIRWSKFPACILLWLKFADFYAVLKCILMLHVGRTARSTKRSSKKISKKLSLSLSLFLSSKEYILEIFILISLSTLSYIKVTRRLILKIWREKYGYNALNFCETNFYKNWALNRL